MAITWVVPGVTDRLGLAGAGGTPPSPASTAAATGADRPGSGGEVAAGVAGAQPANRRSPKSPPKWRRRTGTDAREARIPLEHRYSHMMALRSATVPHCRCCVNPGLASAIIREIATVVFSSNLYRYSHPSGYRAHGGNSSSISRCNRSASVSAITPTPAPAPAPAPRSAGVISGVVIAGAVIAGAIISA